MFPWGHLALAYLAYSGFMRVYNGSTPWGIHPVVVGFTALVPDVVDKSLSWGLGIIPVGRAFMHSIVVIIPLCIAIYWISRELNRSSIGIAGIIGFLTHLLGDILGALFAEPLYGTPTWLLWPVLEVPVDEGAGFHYLFEISIEPFFYFETGLTILALVVWYRHGLPGLDWTRSSFSA